MLHFARWACLALLIGVVGFGSHAVSYAADDVPVDSPPVVSPSADQPVDVTDKVEVKLTGSLRAGKNGELITGVVVRNTSDEDLHGRLVVVVDETGVAGVSLADNDGDLATGEHYVNVLPLAGTLKAGARTTAKRIEFAADVPVAAADRQAISPTVRVFQLATEPTVDDLNTPLVAEENLPGKSYTQSRLNEVMRIQDKYTAELLKHEGVFGTATGEDDNGNLVMLIYTQRHGIAKELPGRFEGVNVEQAVTGTMFRAGPAWDQHQPAKPPASNPLDPQAGTTVIPTDPKARFDRPVPIGVSLFNFDDACASGTLGCRIVFPDGSLGVLTNSHVGSREGVGAVAGPAGDRWTQPGCGDAGGVDVLADVIATLADFQPYSQTGTNYIDAAVGRINSPAADLVSACTPSDGYGFPARAPKAALPRMRVMKYGRTTGFRRGEVRGVNATSLVAGSTGIILYMHQVSIFGDHILFGMPGDSGSLIVAESDRRPVALLFAGGGSETLGNPIDLVLDRFNVAIDDGSSTPPVLGPSGLNPSPGSRKSGRMGGALPPNITP